MAETAVGRLQGLEERSVGHGGPQARRMPPRAPAVPVERHRKRRLPDDQRAVSHFPHGGGSLCLPRSRVAGPQRVRAHPRITSLGSGEAELSGRPAA
jgi:hypothetical protein